MPAMSVNTMPAKSPNMMPLRHWALARSPNMMPSRQGPPERSPSIMPAFAWGALRVDIAASTMIAVIFLMLFIVLSPLKFGGSGVVSGYVVCPLEARASDFVMFGLVVQRDASDVRQHDASEVAQHDAIAALGTGAVTQHDAIAAGAAGAVAEHDACECLRGAHRCHCYQNHRRHHFLHSFHCRIPSQFSLV